MSPVSKTETRKTARAEAVQEIAPPAPNAFFAPPQGKRYELLADKVAFSLPKPLASYKGDMQQLADDIVRVGKDNGIGFDAEKVKASLLNDAHGAREYNTFLAKDGSEYLIRGASVHREVSEKDFAEFRKQHEYIYLESGADYCKPCQAREELIRGAIAAQEGLGPYNVGFVITDASTNLVQRLGVNGLHLMGETPGMLLIDTSKPENEGAIYAEDPNVRIPYPKEKELRYLDGSLGDELAKLGVSRRTLLKSKEFFEAVDAIKKAVEKKEAIGSIKIGDIDGFAVYIRDESGKKKTVVLRVFPKLLDNGHEFDIYNLYRLIESYNAAKNGL